MPVPKVLLPILMLGIGPAVSSSCLAQPPTDSASSAVEADRVAGRSLEEWRTVLQASSETARLRAVKTLALFGSRAEESLLEALEDESEGVRYWAASALGDLPSHTAVKKLALIFENGTEAEQLAAAYALVRGIEEPFSNAEEGRLQAAAFGLLVERLRARERSMVMCAADFLGRLGREGIPAMDELETVYFEHHVDENPIRRTDADYHLSGACLNALRMIDPMWHPTRF